MIRLVAARAGPGDDPTLLAFEEQVTFFRDKLQKLIPTERWDDIWRDAHDAGFMVAGAMKAELLTDLHAAVVKQIDAGGYGIREFRKEFKEIVARHGWTGWTGEGTKAGEAWRTRVILETNVRTSYAAGRYQQAKAIADRRPWWQYHHHDFVATPRPQHVAWDGLCLRHDDPWWTVHFPPKGFGCRCYFSTHRNPPAGARTMPPPEGSYVYENSRTGEKQVLPVGVDPGWDYIPGQSVSDRIQEVMRVRLPLLPARIAKALAAEIVQIMSSRQPPPVQQPLPEGPDDLLAE